MTRQVGQVMAAIALLAGAKAYAVAPHPIGLQCTAVEAWACEEGKPCRAGGDDTGVRYNFDLVAMTYQASGEHGVITDLEEDDGGFMTFVLDSGPRYVHKNADEGDPMTSFLYIGADNMRELRCTARYPPATARIETEAHRDLIGHYYLSGVRETGSELLLRPDGRFSWVMSYGAVDQAAEGEWRIDGKTVLLDAGPDARVEPAFRQMRLQIDQGALLLIGVGKGRYERRP